MTQLEASRELDALIHTKVLGKLLPKYIKTDDESVTSYLSVPGYSISIAAAWQVVEKLGLSVIQYAPDDWVAGSFGESPAGNEFYIDDHFEYSGEGSTAPIAICRAVLDRPKAT
jgi:hypothetical protein